MAEYVIRVGAQSETGLRSSNQDRYVTDAEHRFYLVADGMGGQESGERASGLAADIIPRVLCDRLDDDVDAGPAMLQAMDQAHRAIIEASEGQAPGRRMGTTAVLALQRQNQLYIANLGDSRAYLIRGERVELLTHDHTVADALIRNGTLTREQAEASPWKNVLYKFLGCREMSEGPDLFPLSLEAGDRLVLGTDGLTNFLTDDDLRAGASTDLTPQQWAESLVRLALERGSRDNVTCVVVAFERE
jgi:protein phosphatase